MGVAVLFTLFDQHYWNTVANWVLVAVAWIEQELTLIDQFQRALVFGANQNCQQLFADFTA